MRIAFNGVLIIHGQLPLLTHPISRGLGAVWLAAGLLMIASALTKEPVMDHSETVTILNWRSS